MSIKHKLYGISELLKANPNYALPPNLIRNIKYLSFIESIKNDEEQFTTLRYLSMGITSESIEEKIDTITTSKAIVILLNSSLFTWEDIDSGLTKYAAFILEEAFKELTPIEWAKILGFTNKGL